MIFVSNYQWLKPMKDLLWQCLSLSNCKLGPWCHSAYFVALWLALGVQFSSKLSTHSINPEEMRGEWAVHNRASKSQAGAPQSDALTNTLLGFIHFTYLIKLIVMAWTSLCHFIAQEITPIKTAPSSHETIQNLT